MPPPQGRDEPDFSWLYGGGPDRSGDGDEERADPTDGPRDPEPTQMLPTMNRLPPGPVGSGSAPPRDRREPVRPAPAPGRAPGSRAAPRPAAPPPTGRAPRRRSTWRWVKIALVVWLVFLVAVPAWAWSRIDTVATDPGGDRPAEQSGTTYLLVGSDSREGLSRAEQREFGTGRGDGGRRTDTIMLLHTGAGPNLLLSIPRDSIVEVPGYGTQKVNAAFAFGGARLLVQTLEQETGIRIDDYVEIGFGGFVGAVDAVGGVEICPRTPMRDPQANLDIEAGCQEADGVTALGYARSRKLASLGDIDRARRQREVVSAVGSKAASPWTVLNPVRYFRLNQAGSDSVRVGEETSMLSAGRFAFAMTRVTGDSGLTCSVPIVDLAVTWDPVRAPRLFGLIAEDRTEDVPRGLCGSTGLR